MRMDNWRRKRSENNNQEGSWMRSQTRNSSAVWQSTVPSWEKKFCWEIGGVPWWKVLETKKLLHMYDNTLKWEDSAGEEAFNNAKARYWAKLNGLQCDIPLPDPNAYIDDVDWDSNIDPELIKDLYSDFVPDENNGEKVLIFGDAYAKSQGLTDSGWGEADDGYKNVTDTDLEKIREESSRVYADIAAEGIDHGRAWDVEDKWESKVRENEDRGGKGYDSGWNKWENKVRENGDGGAKGWNCDSGWNKWENKVNKFGNNRGDNGYNGNYMSRYKTTRFHGDEGEFGRNAYNNGNNDGGYNGNYRENNGREMSSYNRNGRRRDNFVHDERPCRPLNYRGSAKQGNHWGWEKSVSGL